VPLVADDVVPLVLAACPSFRPLWEGGVEADHAPEEPGGTRLHYADAAAVARHAVDLLLDGRTEELPALLAVVERLHVDGDAYVRELATIGYLEDLQTAAERAGVPDEALTGWLGPESLGWWRGVRAFWDGDLPAVRPLGADEQPGDPGPTRRRWWRRG
jgi:hypothetical protein